MKQRPTITIILFATFLLFSTKVSAQLPSAADPESFWINQKMEVLWDDFNNGVAESSAELKSQNTSTPTASEDDALREEIIRNCEANSEIRKLRLVNECRKLGNLLVTISSPESYGNAYKIRKYGENCEFKRALFGTVLRLNYRLAHHIPFTRLSDIAMQSVRQFMPSVTKGQRSLPLTAIMVIVTNSVNYWSWFKGIKKLEPEIYFTGRLTEAIEMEPNAETRSSQSPEDLVEMRLRDEARLIEFDYKKTYPGKYWESESGSRHFWIPAFLVQELVKTFRYPKIMAVAASAAVMGAYEIQSLCEAIAQKKKQPPECSSKDLRELLRHMQSSDSKHDPIVSEEMRRHGTRNDIKAGVNGAIWSSLPRVVK